MKNQNYIQLGINERSLLAGFLLFTKEEKKFKIDLLLIDQKYRKHGIGKKFITQAIKTFPDVTECESIVLDYNIDSIFFIKN